MSKEVKQKKPLNNSLIIKRVAFDAVFAALTALLYAVFNIGEIIKTPFFPSFLEINISMIPVIICAFMLGPWDAALCVIIRCLIKWLYPGTNTGFVGEIADIIIGLSACIPAGIIYHKTEFKHKTLYAFLSVIICWVLSGVISNIFINIPWYSKFYFQTNYYKDGVPDVLIGMVGAATNIITFGKVSISKENFMFVYILFAVIPFNLMLSFIVVIITAPIHKRLKVLYDIIGSKV
ncbi:MAG: ECF transporter S component [Anaeroplasma sp.]